MKVDLRQLTDDELTDRLEAERKELFNVRFQHATGALENTARLALVKRDIARIITIRGERQAALERQ